MSKKIREKKVKMNKEILNMKTFKVIIMCVSMGFASSAFSQVDIDKKMKLLEKNVANAQSNYNQFKENLVISVKNFNEATRVVNELRNLKKQAVRDTKRSENNAVVIGQVISKYDEYKAQEQANILKEEEAATRLEALIVSIRENIEKRKGLIASYTDEIKNANSEIEKWRVKKREVAAVIEDIGSRESGALDERKKWMGKKEVYKKETKKWSRETKSAKKTLLTFEKLRD